MKDFKIMFKTYLFTFSILLSISIAFETDYKNLSTTSAGSSKKLQELRVNPLRQTFWMPLLKSQPESFPQPPTRENDSSAVNSAFAWDLSAYDGNSYSQSDLRAPSINVLPKNT